MTNRDSLIERWELPVGHSSTEMTRARVAMVEWVHSPTRQTHYVQQSSETDAQVAAALTEHQRRIRDNDPYTDWETVDDIQDRIEKLRGHI